MGKNAASSKQCVDRSQKRSGDDSRMDEEAMGKLGKDNAALQKQKREKRKEFGVSSSFTAKGEEKKFVLAQLLE